MPTQYIGVDPGKKATGVGVLKFGNGSIILECAVSLPEEHMFWDGLPLRVGECGVYPVFEMPPPNLSCAVRDRFIVRAMSVIYAAYFKQGMYCDISTSIEKHSVRPSSWRKTVLGSAAKYSKDMAIEFVRKTFGVTLDSHDAAEAVCIAYWGYLKDTGKI